MKITVKNVRCQIDEMPPYPWDKTLLKDFTRRAKNAFWAQKRTPGWSGATNFISPKKGMFATGLLPLVQEWCQQKDIDLELDDQRTIPAPAGIPITPTMLKDIELRDYQVAALDAMIQKGRGLVKVSTGGGKTEIIAGICKHLNLDTMIVVERINLAEQTRDRLVKRGFSKKEIGIVGAGLAEDNRLITITTVQSSHNIADKSRYKVVICDESHHSKARTYIELLRDLDNAYYRYGLSGTVFSDDPVDDTYRIAQFGPIIYEIGTQELIEEGVLAKPTIRMIEIKKPYAGHIHNYLEQYKLGIANNMHRNHIIAKFAKGFRGKTLILFKLIEHGQILAGLIPNAMYCDGDTPPQQRSRILKAFNRMPEGTLIASTILDEGIDFSSIEHLIIAGGEKSIIKGIQRLGRGLRNEGDKSHTVNVIDFMDRTSKTLEKHSKERMKLFKSEGHTVKLFQLSEEEDGY